MKDSTCALVLWIAICTPTRALVTSDAPGTHVVNQMDDTFGVNLDGVALIGGIDEEVPKGGCGGALVTDRHVATAAHCIDINGDLMIDPELFLFPSEVLFEIDGTWTAVDYDPAKAKWSERWETSRADIAVLTLEVDAPREIPRYPLYGGVAEIGQPFVLAGYGRTGFGPTGLDFDFDPIRTKRAGLNQYDALALDDGAQFLVSDFDSGQAEHNSFGDLGFGADEVGTTEHDSGSPGFLDGAVASVVAFGGQLRLVDATDEPDSSWGERTFGTRVSDYQDFILTATDGQAVFVIPDESSILGDFDDDQLLTAGDIDLLSRAIRFGIDHASFDLDGDDDVNQLDRETWIQDLLGSFFGDTDLNQSVDLADFLALSEHFTKKAGWGGGDFDGNGVVGFADFLNLSDNFGQSASEPATVPEPSGFSLVCILGLVLLRRGIGHLRSKGRNRSSAPKNSVVVESQ